MKVSNTLYNSIKEDALTLINSFGGIEAFKSLPHNKSGCNQIWSILNRIARDRSKPDIEFEFSKRVLPYDGRLEMFWQENGVSYAQMNTALKKMTKELLAL